MKLTKLTAIAVLALWLSGCGANGLNFNPNDMGKVVIGNNPSSPADEAPLVPDNNGVLVRAAIPGVAAPTVAPAPQVVFSGVAN